MEKTPFPPGINKAIKELDYTLLGPHTRLIYDNLDKNDAKVIAQLCSGNAKLNQFLLKIKVIELATCACGVGSELIKYFLFSYIKWIHQRRELNAKYPGKKGNIRFFFRAKGPQDDHI